MNDKIPNLLPCPFCGSKATIQYGGFGEVFAACTRGGCVHFGGGWSNSIEMAEYIWNTRAKSIPCVEGSTQAVQASAQPGVVVDDTRRI